MMVLINGLQADAQKDLLFANHASPVFECVAAE
jgi:hypothetical protein